MYLCFHLYTCMYVRIPVYTIILTGVSEINNGGGGGTIENCLEEIMA